MTDDRAADAATWDKDQMETDDPGDDPGTASATDDPGSPMWNKGEMAEERADGSGGPGTEDVDPAGGLSGEGSNPGGGGRWADRGRDS